jgi:hypothetical protein
VGQRLRNEYGERVLVWRPGRLPRGMAGRVLPRFRITRVQVLAARRWYRYEWRPRCGWWCVASGLKGCPVTMPDLTQPYPSEDAMKRRSAPAGVHSVQPALPAKSTLFARFTGIAEFVSATSYEDGSPRTPGYFQLKNRGIAYELTFYDPDSGTRLPVRAATLDEVFSLGHQLLGVEEAPWELDVYLTEQLEKRNRKKKKGA